MMRRAAAQRVLGAAVAVVVVFGLAGCGGDDQPGGSQSSGVTGNGQSTKGTDGAKGGGHRFASVDICSIGSKEITALLDADHIGNVTSKWVDEGQSEDTKACMWTGKLGEQMMVELSPYDMYRPISDVPADEAPKELSGPWDDGWITDSASDQQMAWRRDDLSLDIDSTLGGESKLTPELAKAIDAAVKAAGH